MAADRKKRKFKFSNLFRKTNADKRTTNANTKPKKNKDKTSDDGEHTSKLKVINGTRKRRRIIRIIVYAVIVAIIITLVVLNALTPTGLIEAMQNGYATWGEGKFPITVYSSNATDYNSRNGVMGIVNDSFFELYDDEGKLLQAVSHGMSDPVLETSEARFLLYDRDRYSLNIYNYSDELYTAEFDKPIVSADIGRDGTYAVVTDSDTSKSTVFVYDKDNESVYKWSSANYYITDVAVSNDGEKIAVSLINSNGGIFESYIYVLDFDSAEPKYRFNFNDIVSSITSCSESYILANGFDRAYSVPWNGGGELDLEVSGVVRCYDYELNGGSCLVFGREDNEQVNTVTVLNSKGNITATIEFNSNIYDVAVSETRVAVLSDNEVFVYDRKGNLKNTYSLEKQSNFVGISEDNCVIVLDNTELIKIIK